ncbi:MAG: serine hydrolase [Anaerolineae bacterium]
MYSTPEPPRRGGLPVLEIAGSLMILAATVLFVTQLSSFSAERQRLPEGMEMGGVPVGSLSRIEAQAFIEQVYGSPITVVVAGNEIRLDPNQVGFRVNTDVMLARADELRTEGTFWSGFWNYIWRRPQQSFSIELSADYSDQLLQGWLADVAQRYDRPPADPMTLAANTEQTGYMIDQQAALPLLREALMRPVNRVVELPISTQTAEAPGIVALDRALNEYLISTGFEGVVSAHVIDLQTGEELEINLDMRQPGNPQELNCEVAYAAMSTMKIPIMVEYFRYLDFLPLPYEYEKVDITMVQSGNWSANSMLLDIGFGSQERGVEIVTQSMRDVLGLENTFIAAPYDEEVEVYVSTPAREAARTGTCVNTRPDPAMQTTARDLASLLDMIYQCAKFNGGGLIAAYGDQFNQTECEMMLEVMGRNLEGQLILAGVPEDVIVAHKHGWASDTHADAGIVFSPGGDYVLTMFLWADLEWLPATITFPIMERISEITFNYFNPDLIDVPRRGLNPELFG